MEIMPIHSLSDACMLVISWPIKETPTYLIPLDEFYHKQHRHQSFSSSCPATATELWVQNPRLHPMS